MPRALECVFSRAPRGLIPVLGGTFQHEAMPIVMQLPQDSNEIVEEQQGQSRPERGPAVA